jgi:hypothetical protein
MPFTATLLTRRPRAGIAVIAATLSIGLLAGCTSTPAQPTATVTATATHTPAPVVITAEPSPAASAAPEEAEPGEASAYARPLWLGANPLAPGPNDLGKRGPTPEELRDRQLEPRAFLPDPASDEWVATITDVPADVAARSTWEKGCPVGIDDLSYVTMPYWGFDKKVHQGEMLIASSVADDVTGAFEKIYEARFPIEEMRVINKSDRDAPATGDQNVTSGFTCRKIVGGSTKWSEHSKGLAVDINPFHNPFIRDDALFPELSEAYLDRDNVRAGMIDDAGAVFDAFEAIDWYWGGAWPTHSDWMHFSLTNH